MTSWPMIERCMLQQWKGYDEYRRHCMDTCWARAISPGLGNMMEEEVALWQVDRPMHRLTLMSIKYAP